MLCMQTLFSLLAEQAVILLPRVGEALKSKLMLTSLEGRALLPQRPQSVDRPVTKWANSQSDSTAKTRWPLNSPPATSCCFQSTHSAMQYVCQLCGTKEQPFCDWTGPAPKCQAFNHFSFLPRVASFLLSTNKIRNTNCWWNQISVNFCFTSLFSPDKILFYMKLLHKMAATNWMFWSTKSAAISSTKEAVCQEDNRLQI